MDPLRIEYRAPDQLKPYPRNARTHSKMQIRQIAESIRQFGFTNPVLVESEGMILRQDLGSDIAIPLPAVPNCVV
jgi:ParB-like chromosome segregation protein Spo0J